MISPNDILLRVYGELPTPENIWNFRQNNPELVVKDLARALHLNEMQKEIVRTILLARGVNKWLKVRRDLIAYKHQLKQRIKSVQTERLQLKRQGKTQRAASLKESLKILEEVRASLRAMCHSDRFVEWPHSTSRRTLREMNTIRASVLCDNRGG